MTWARFEHETPRNIKLAALSNEAFRVWVEAILWSVGAGTDGVLPSDVPTAVWTTRSRPKRAIEELLTVHLLEPDPRGLYIHDFADYQEHSDVTRARRAETAARVRRHRERNGNGRGNALQGTRGNA